MVLVLEVWKNICNNIVEKKYNMNDDDENTVKPEFTSLLKMFDDGGEKNESKFVVAKRIDIFLTIFVAPDVAKLVEEIFRVRKKI